SHLFTDPPLHHQQSFESSSLRPLHLIKVDGDYVEDEFENDV
ncbi:hypothetical protein L195_g064037, partial [Trifolium pratense]